MKVVNTRITLDLSLKEVEVIMVALSATAEAPGVKMIPWDSCPFFRLYRDMVRLTGFRTVDLEELTNKLSAR